MERTQLDNQRWNSSIGKTYYTLCPDNKDYYRTVYIRHNPFTNALQPMISNAVYGVVPDGMDEIPPLMLNRLMKLQMTSAFF